METASMRTASGTKTDPNSTPRRAGRRRLVPSRPLAGHSPRRNRMRTAIVVVSLVALVLAGCGGSKKSSAHAGADDADAKASARTFVTEVEACFVDQQDYTGCKKPAGTQAP